MTPEQAIRVCAEWVGWGESHYQGRWLRDYTSCDHYEYVDRNPASATTHCALAEQCRVKLYRAYEDSGTAWNNDDAAVQWFARHGARYFACESPIERLMALAAVLGCE